MDKIKISSKGFTLLELLIVVLIIGILAAIALPQYQKVKEKRVMTEGMQLTKQIAEANMRYYLVNGEYSDNIRNLDIEFAGKSVVYVTKRVQTDKFIVAASGSTGIEIAIVHRIPFGESYCIRIYPDNPNSFSCLAYENSASKIQKELCNKLNSEGHL